MKKLAIRAYNLSKAYQLGEFSTGTISRDIERWFHKLRGKEDPFLKIGETNDRTIKGESDIVWSLKDIIFDVQQGDAVGIIGRNGAGKSTLLKILSRVTTPTTGSVKVKGRIASLLEVGTGFHPELTGKENIFLNGAILGMRKNEIKRKFDEIVDFAGVERYIDTPVKRYSSGMYVRLAFAVAAHLDSEILIVDEVLAVGDAEFQKKCLGKMGEVSKGQGRTVLFVSHNMASIASLCNTGILLNNGRVQRQGDVNACILEYMSKSAGAKAAIKWENPGSLFYDKAFAVKTVSLVDRQLNPRQNGLINPSEKLYLLIEGDVESHENELKIGYQLFDEKENLLFTSLTTDLGKDQWPQLSKGKNSILTEIPINILKPGNYKVVMEISIHNKRWICNPEMLDLILTFEKMDLDLKSELFDKKHDLISISGKYDIIVK